MRLIVQRYVYEAPGLAIIPETDFEAAVLARYWKIAEVDIGKASGEAKSANGLQYTIRFKEPKICNSK